LKSTNTDKALDLVVEYYQKGDIKKAEDICSKILKKESSNVDAMQFLGLICYRLRDHNLAIKHIQRALQIG
jgi:Tfp pilus assembly protein PilF